MQLSVQVTELDFLLAEATVLGWEARRVGDSAATDPTVPDHVVRKLDDLTIGVYHLRDAIHDAALDPIDELAVPRLSRYPWVRN